MLSILALFPGAKALLPLVVEGNKFYQTREDYQVPGKSFTVFGVDYQPGGSSGFSLSNSNDTLTDAEACRRDAYLLNQLGANAIRVYSVSPWLNHDECMTALNDAGIYVLLDVNTPDSSINRDDPASSYNSGYLNNVFGLVDAFKDYPNLMGFIAGNEIINDNESASLDPVYLRAVIRDVKQYISLWANRSIPVGYAAADVLEYRTTTWNYLQCQSGNDTVDKLSRADFFGINSYSWCSGSNDFASSGYQDIIDTFNSTSIPILFTEYGCNKNLPRTFDEVDGGIYGPLSDFVSGGFVYEYSNEVSNYGLVDIDSDGNISMLKDYDNLKTAFAKVNTTQTTPPASEPTAPACNKDMQTKSFDWNFTLPSCPAHNAMYNGGGNRNVGAFTTLNSTSFSFGIKDSNGDAVTPTISYNSGYLLNYQTNVPESVRSKTAGSGSATSAASSTVMSSSSSKKKKNSGSKNALSWSFGAFAALIASLI